MKFVILMLLSSGCFLADQDLIKNVELYEPNLAIGQDEILKDSVKKEIFDSKNQEAEFDAESNFKNQDSAITENSNLAVQPVGLNTIDNDEEGNWILKKLWWQEGQNRYNDILKSNDELLPLQLLFLVLKNEAEKKFFQQWRCLDLDEQQLNGKLVELRDRILADKEKKIVSKENDQQRIAKLNNSLNILDELKKYFEDLLNNQTKLEEGFNHVTDNLKICRNYETESWTLLRQIAATLDDQKARAFYNKIDANYKNSTNLASYLKNEYLSYMNKLVEQQNNILANIKEKIQLLSSSGYQLGKEAKANNSQIDESKSSEKTKEERLRLQQAKIQKANAKKSFLDKLYDKLNSWFSKIF